MKDACVTLRFFNEGVPVGQKCFELGGPEYNDGADYSGSELPEFDSLEVEFKTTEPNPGYKSTLDFYFTKDHKKVENIEMDVTGVDHRFAVYQDIPKFDELNILLYYHDPAESSGCSSCLDHACCSSCYSEEDEF
uniref:Uncharacterized protein n=1 Tax=Graphocephala atropunctata TaxID=36148 RepID=A0A1B6L7W1_9HEMI